MISRADLAYTFKYLFAITRQAVMFAHPLLALAALVSIVYFGPWPTGMNKINAQEANPASAAVAQGSAFTYQGQLHDGSGAANGQFDFRFRLFNAAEGGDQVGSDVLLNGVTVSSGLFTVALDFGASAFMGEARWLEIAVKSAGGADYTPLTPRQALTAAPYALYALNGVPGPQGPQGLQGTQGIQGIQGVPGSPGSADAWSRTGNAATDPATNFLGTTDNQALEIRVNNQRVYQFIPKNGPNIIGGYFQNNISSNSVASIIAGGGADFGSGNILLNSINGSSATISGGSGNTVDDSGAVIGGGLRNFVGSINSVIDGGVQNSIYDSYESSAIGGGQENEIVGSNSVIGGGLSNATFGAGTTISGGTNNTASASFSTVGGGTNNIASGNYSTVPGGAENRALTEYSFAAGRHAFAIHPGAFVWADSTNTDFSSTGNDQFLVKAAGGMGVGTANPQNQLHVLERVSGDASATNHVVHIQNISSAGSADVLALSIPDPIAQSDNNFITFFDGTSNTDGIGSIEGNGSDGIFFQTPGADYAEWLPKRVNSEQIERGEIVGLFGGEISLHTEGADRIMAVSTGAIVAGNDPGDEARDDYALVAFVGQVDVQVHGVVLAGDFIVPSGFEDGTAVAVSPEAITSAQFAHVVGQAWESSSETQLKPIRTVVGLAHQDPTIQRLLVQLQNQQATLAALEARLVALEGLVASE